MSRGEMSIIHRQMRTLFDLGAIGAMTDGQLLELFSTRRDEVAEYAFEALVKRHGPMVLGTCRRILRNSQDSADAFQATFLVLVHRASDVRVTDSLGRWLYGVSRRVALQARATAMRRSYREVPGAEHAAVVIPDPNRDELLAALDEEVARLPEKYRAAVLLCDLGGTNHAEAARQLHCPVGTVESRLSRGRELLRTRLTRRGLAPAALTSGGMLWSGSASASASTALPTPLVEATVRAALQLATGRTMAADVVAASVAALTRKVLKTMLMAKLKAGAFGLLAVGTLAIGVVALASSANRPPGKDQADPPREQARAPEVGRNLTAGKPGPKLIKVKQGDLLRIEVLEALPGRPLTGVRIVRPDGTISLDFYGDLYVAGLNRDEIKVKLIELLRKWIPDEVLGLIEMNEDGKWMLVDPVDSGRVFIEDHFYQQGDQERRLQSLETKMEEILMAVRGLGKAPVAPPPAPAPRPKDDKAPRKPPQPEPVTDADGHPIPSIPFPAPTRVQAASDPFPVPPPVPGPAPATTPTRAPVPTSEPAVPAAAGTAHEERLKEMDRKLDRILRRFEEASPGPRD